MRDLIERDGQVSVINYANREDVTRSLAYALPELFGGFEPNFALS